MEDGPTLTHGGMKLGAGTVAAKRFEAKELVNPRPYTVGKLTETFNIYKDIGSLLPAMGYGKQQLKDLEETINNADCDSVIIGTPIDLTRVININKPYTRVHYEFGQVQGPSLDQVLKGFVEEHNLI